MLISLQCISVSVVQLYRLPRGVTSDAVWSTVALTTHIVVSLISADRWTALLLKPVMSVCLSVTLASTPKRFMVSKRVFAAYDMAIVLVS